MLTEEEEQELARLDMVLQDEERAVLERAHELQCSPRLAHIIIHLERRLADLEESVNRMCPL